MSIKIKDGDWIVIQDRWKAEAHQAIRVTAKLVFWQSEHYAKPFRVPLDRAVFAGEKDAAVRLAQQLSSSTAQQYDEERKARERRIARDENLIRAAQQSAH